MIISSVASTLTSAGRNNHLDIFGVRGEVGVDKYEACAKQ